MTKPVRGASYYEPEFFVIASRQSGVASERVCVFLCLFLCTHKEREYFFQRNMEVRMDILPLPQSMDYFQSPTTPHCYSLAAARSYG